MGAFFWVQIIKCSGKVSEGSNGHSVLVVSQGNRGFCGIRRYHDWNKDITISESRYRIFFSPSEQGIACLVGMGDASFLIVARVFPDTSGGIKMLCGCFTKHNERNIRSILCQSLNGVLEMHLVCSSSFHWPVQSEIEYQNIRLSLQNMPHGFLEHFCDWLGSILKEKLERDTLIILIRLPSGRSNYYCFNSGHTPQAMWLRHVLCGGI